MKPFEGPLMGLRDITVNLIHRCPWLWRMVRSSGKLDYGREIIYKWSKLLLESPSDVYSILDVGCGTGTDLENVRVALEKRKVELYGVDINPQYEKLAREKRIQVLRFDIERTKWPFPDKFFNLIICNQILEHTKEIFWIFSELYRTLKDEGLLIIGVPNLAALHNRLFLIFGDHPPCIEIMGPHVRGFTKKGLVSFAQTEGLFKLRDFRGSNLYPFPPAISRVLTHLFPNLAASIFFLLQKGYSSSSFLQVLRSKHFATAYFNGTEPDEPSTIRYSQSGNQEEPSSP